MDIDKMLAEMYYKTYIFLPLTRRDERDEIDYQVKKRQKL